MPAICATVDTDQVSAASMSMSAGDSFQTYHSYTRLEGAANGWHTCTCEDGTTYECKSKLGDGAACCGRSMPAICGADERSELPAAGNEASFAGTPAGTGHESCSCPDDSGTVYTCKTLAAGAGAGSCCSAWAGSMCASQRVAQLGSFAPPGQSAVWNPCTHLACHLSTHANPSFRQHCSSHTNPNPHAALGNGTTTENDAGYDSIYATQTDIAFDPQTGLTLLNPECTTDAATPSAEQTRIVVLHHGHELSGVSHKCFLTGDGSLPVAQRSCACLCSTGGL
jgi:hypothetical protein